MSSSRQQIEREIAEWKRALPPASGRKAAQARQLRDHIRAFTFGFRDWMEEAMRPQGMTVAQLRMLFAVRYQSDASSAKIARLCQVTPQTLQAMLQRAEREGWLSRHPAAHNQRILVPALTRKGEALLTEAMNATAAFETEVWRGVTVAELESINAAFTEALSRMAEAKTGPASTPRPRTHRGVRGAA